MKYLTLTLRVDADHLIQNIMEGYPEYSSDSLRCIDFDYKKLRFEFLDVEVTSDNPETSLVVPKINKTLRLAYSNLHNAVTYKIGREELRAGLQLLLEALFEGKLPGIAQYVLRDFQDPGNWDATAADALVQYAIFGRLVYG